MKMESKKDIEKPLRQREKFELSCSSFKVANTSRLLTRPLYEINKFINEKQCPT